MNVLEQLRSDMNDAGTEACENCEDETNACLAILDEFITGHEVIAAFEHQFGGWRKNRWLRVYEPDPHRFDYCVSAGPIIVPRKPEPHITDQPIEKRMAHLEDEVQHRCGNLGRRVNALEFTRDRPLLAAAEAMSEACGHVVIHSGRLEGMDEFHAAQRALVEAIKEERER
jgi:hypothetical protein